MIYWLLYAKKSVEIIFPLRCSHCIFLDETAVLACWVGWGIFWVWCRFRSNDCLLALPPFELVGLFQRKITPTAKAGATLLYYSIQIINSTSPHSQWVPDVKESRVQHHARWASTIGPYQSCFSSSSFLLSSIISSKVGSFAFKNKYITDRIDTPDNPTCIQSHKMN